MKQVLQDLKNGKTIVVDVPAPAIQNGQVLIRTRVSLISPGTERMLVEFGKAGWLEKARQQPDKVRMVLDKIRTDGLLPTIKAVKNRLDQPLPLGYCNVGTVIGVGEGVEGFRAGDRVASNGWHAEEVSVPKLLCAKVPTGVSDQAAAFTVLGAIALQGVRLSRSEIGEAVAVVGLGLVGLLAVQMLRAMGCRVLGIDLDREKLSLARRFGAEVVNLSAGEEPVTTAMSFSRGRGMDAVLICAATKSSEPVHQAARMCRKRGRMVLVGVTGLELSRADFYEKELSFQVSCSYGPGRYDPLYEERGQDYPAGFVRWTAQRNFEAVLDLMSEGKLDVEPLISHRFPIEKAGQAYELLTKAERSLGILIEYPEGEEKGEGSGPSRIVNLKPATRPLTGELGVGVIGAGAHATAQLIPALSSAGVNLKTVASAKGVSASYVARRFGFEICTTDPEVIFNDPEIQAVIVATRHDTHASYAIQALRSGKHVFVEKPLAIRMEDLDEIEATFKELGDQSPILMLGFNRRFAPHIIRLRELLASVRIPKTVVITVNAGEVPVNHWTRDPQIGGGRLVGEGCHFIDLAHHLIGERLAGWKVTYIESGGEVADGGSIILQFAEGSIATIHYLTSGHKSFPKERVEVFCAGRVLQLDNFRILRGYGWPGFRVMRLWHQDKGQKACVSAFLNSIRGEKTFPMTVEEILEVSRLTLKIARAARG